MAKHLLSGDSLYTLYCSLFLPYINYCLEIWGNTYKTNVNPIYILKKKGIRIIGNVGYRDSTNNLFYDLNIVRFFYLVELNICNVMYKAINLILPANLLQLLDL